MQAILYYIDKKMLLYLRFRLERKSARFPVYYLVVFAEQQQLRDLCTQTASTCASRPKESHKSSRSIYLRSLSLKAFLDLKCSPLPSLASGQQTRLPMTPSCFAKPRNTVTSFYRHHTRSLEPPFLRQSTKDPKIRHRYHRMPNMADAQFATLGASKHKLLKSGH